MNGILRSAIKGSMKTVKTGLYYNRFRYYDPSTGAYISQDPIGLAGGSRLYGYVHDTNSWLYILGLHKNNNSTVGDWVLYDIVDAKLGNTQK